MARHRDRGPSRPQEESHDRRRLGAPVPPGPACSRRWWRRSARRLGRIAADGHGGRPRPRLARDSPTTPTTADHVDHQFDGRAATPSRPPRPGPASASRGRARGGAGIVGWSISAPRASIRSTAPTPASTAGRRPRRSTDQVGVGVVGESDDWGVLGLGTVGVYGYGTYGVVGESASTAAGVTALAASATDLALDVVGKVKFSRSGRSNISAGASSKLIYAGRRHHQQQGLRRPAQQSQRPVRPGRGGRQRTVQDLPQRLGVVDDVRGVVRARLTMKDPRKAGRTPSALHRPALHRSSARGCQRPRRRSASRRSRVDSDWSRMSTRSVPAVPTVSPAKARAGSHKASPPGTFGLPD